MKQLTLDPMPARLKSLVACLLTFAIWITPIAAVGAASIARAPAKGTDKTATTDRTEKPKSSAEEIFVNPSTAPATETSASLPGPKPEPAPEPPAPLPALSAIITPISPNPRNSAVSSIQIVFNTSVTGFDLSDLTLKLNNGANLLTGAQTLNSADNVTWTLGNLSGITGAQGTYVLKLTAAGSNIQDSTNAALASDATASWVMDTTAPTVTVEQAISQPDPVTGPTGTTTINFTATFSESVTGLTASGVTIFGTANPTIVNVTGSGTTYNLAVQGMSQTGTVRASVNASAATDSAGNGNAASTSADNTVQFNADNFTAFEVNTTADTNDAHCDALGTGSGNQDCTLREAINAANADFGAETITFNSTVFAAPGPYTINLSTTLPDITTDMTIQGPGAKVLTVKGFAMFNLPNNATVNISGLTLTNGQRVRGGAILMSNGTLTLTNVAITGNTALEAGGGIYVFGGTLNVISSTISGNHQIALADGDEGGGGICNHNGQLTVTNTTISGNNANNGGGGLAVTQGSATLANTTVAANTAQGWGGGGILRRGGTVTLKSTIVGDNTDVTGPDVVGAINSDGFNLIENTTGATITETLNPGTNITGQDPQLFPLADNGGPTFTHALQCTSPAIDKGFKFTTTTDQRGGTRPFDFADAVYPNAAGGDGSDIGAFETQTGDGCQPVAVPPSPQPSTNEDTPVVITLTGTYSQNVNLSFTITQNPTIGQLGAISAPNCTFNLSMTCTATVTYTPNANANGADLFKFKVSAGGLDSDPADVNVTVNATNDPPTFLQAGNQTVLEDAGPQTVVNFITTFSPGPPDESGQSVQFIVTNNTNPGLFSAGPAIDTSGTLTYTPAANANGSATITIVAKDNGGGTDTSAPQSFTITVLSVNDAPSFTVGADQTNLEDSGQQVVNNFATGISAGPAQESAQTVQFIITNNTNSALFSAQPAISSSGTLTYTPAADANGSATITVVLQDNGGTANGGQDTSAPQTFTINITPVNDAPSFTKGADQTVLEDAGAQTVAGWATNLSAGPANESGQTLGFIVTGNTNPGLFSAGPAIGSTGTLTYTPAANSNGSATITIVLQDNGGTANAGVDTSPPQSFTITVNPVNDAPSFTKGPDQTVPEDAGAQSVNNWATAISSGPANESGQTVTFQVTGNTNAGLFAVGPAISPTGTLTYTPAANANGSATVTIVLQDNGGTANGGVDTSAPQTFVITVNSFNDAPSFAKGPNQTVNEDAGAQTVNNWATAISPGPANESGQTVTFQVTGNTNPGLFAVGPAISPTGTLTYTPATNINGSATITIVLQDNGGTANGGVDTSAPQTFVITVNSVNDAPSFTKGPNQTVNEDAGAQTVAGWATNISAGPANESGQTVAFEVTGNTNPGLFSVAPAISSTGTLTYTPAANANGTATITVVLKDNGGTANGGVDTSAPQTFTITVNGVNDAPVNSVPGPQNTTVNALLVFSAGTGNPISISDVDAASDAVQVTLKATDGTITLNGTAGLSFTVGDGTDDPLMTFTGSLASINAALAGMKNLALGSGVITITTNDLGHNGTGGALTDVDTIQVTVADNLAPQILTIPGTDKAIAFDSVTFVVDPFALMGSNNFTADHRTHITIFALHAQLRPGETFSAITAEADVAGTTIPLIVESANTVPNFDWLSQIVIKFPDGFSTGGGGPHDAKIKITLRGQSSNQALIIVVPAPRP